MAFKDVIGQDKSINILLRTIQRGRLPSSYLFAGESGIGKKFTAINLAKAVNCLTPPSPPLTKGGNEGGYALAKEGNGGVIDSCDECSSCKKIDAGVHPDFLLISPEGGQIRIEEIRAIDDILSFKPFEGRNKVVIVDEADTMNPFAANAFLKTLEEPPKDSLIILISSNPERLPDTIRSRCSRVNFTPLSHEACRKVIKTASSQKSKAPPTHPSPSRGEDKGEGEKNQESKDSKDSKDSRLSTLVRLSMGRPGLATAGDLIEDRAWFIKLLKGMLNAEKDGWTSKEEMEKWFDLLLILFRDIAIIKITQDETNLINIDLKDYLNKLSSSMDLKVIIENYQRLNTLKGYFNFNLNRSLTWNYTGSLLRKTIGVKYA
jgi:DNA polymerase-3 subunit delta'